MGLGDTGSYTQPPSLEPLHDLPKASFLCSAAVTLTPCRSGTLRPFPVAAVTLRPVPVPVFSVRKLPRILVAAANCALLDALEP